MTTIFVQIGPPGCGKTQWLSRQCGLAAQQYGHDKVIACSLTRTGAREIAERADLPPSQFGTVHSFAHRALGSPVVAETKIKEWNIAHPELPLALHGLTTDDGYILQDDATPADNLKLQYSSNRTMGRKRLLWNEDVKAFAGAWEDWKTQCGYLDFTDLIETALSDCDTAPGAPAVIIDDEAQDTGALEMQLLMKWAKRAEHLVLSGDFCQSLYGWRGSDPLLLQRLWLKHDPDRQPLQQSYRLPRAVYDYAYEWAGRFQETMRVSFEPRKEDGKEVQGSVCQIGMSFSQMTPQVIEQYVEMYTENNQSLMFLATCGYMLEPITKSLRAAGIPFHNPRRPNHGGWNPLPQQRTKGLTIIDRVLAFLRPLEAVWGDAARFWTVSDLKAWVSGLPSTGILKPRGQAALQALPETMTDKEIAQTFGEWFTPEALPHIVPFPDPDWYLAQIKGSEKLRAYVREVTQRRGFKALRERPRVTVGTIHSLKGAESDTIIVSPDISLPAYHAARGSVAAADELRRTIYVGLTRAKSNLLLCQGSNNLCVRW